VTVVRPAFYRPASLTIHMIVRNNLDLSNIWCCMFWGGQWLHTLQNY